MRVANITSRVRDIKDKLKANDAPTLCKTYDDDKKRLRQICHYCCVSRINEDVRSASLGVLLMSLLISIYPISDPLEK